VRPSTRRGAALLLLVATLAAPAAAAGQGAGPGELWDAYPLDPVTTAPAPQEPVVPAQGQGAAPPAAPLSEPDDSIPTTAIVVAIAAFVLLVGACAALAVSRARERRTWTYAHAGPDHAEPPPETAAEPEPPPRPAPAVDDLALARLAADYLAIVAGGSRRPVVDLAARHSMPDQRARRLLGRARSRGILAGAGSGRAGGVLTDRGRELLEGGPSPAWPPPPGPGGAQADRVGRAPSHKALNGNTHS
jgi:hypothetical protein